MKMFGSSGKEYFDTDKAFAVIQKNEGTYPKRINIHRRVWKFFDPKNDRGWAYGIEVPAAEWLMSNAKCIEFKETDSGYRYIISTEHFRERAVKDQLGKYDAQYFVRTDQMDKTIEPKQKKIKVKKEETVPTTIERIAQNPVPSQMSLFG